MYMTCTVHNLVVWGRITSYPRYSNVGLRSISPFFWLWVIFSTGILDISWQIWLQHDIKLWHNLGCFRFINKRKSESKRANKEHQFQIYDIYLIFCFILLECSSLIGLHILIHFTAQLPFHSAAITPLTPKLRVESLGSNSGTIILDQCQWGPVSLS